MSNSEPQQQLSNPGVPLSSQIHPQVSDVVRRLRDAGLIPPKGSDVQSVRHYLARIAGVAAAKSVPLKQELDLTMQVGAREVPCRLYWPDDKKSASLMFYCHGGGFRHGALSEWDAPLRQLVRHSGVAVLSIEYALAPEYPFPAAFDEVVTIARQVMADGSIARFEVDGFAFGGDSAGANLALGASIALRQEGISSLKHLLLFYGVYAKETQSESWQRLDNLGGHGLSAEAMRSYWESYLPGGESDWRVQPLSADLTGLPPTRLIVGELDPLLDQNRALANKLQCSGVEVHLTECSGIIHGVLRFNELAPVVQDLIRVEAKALSGISRPLHK